MCQHCESSWQGRASPFLEDKGLQKIRVLSYQVGMIRYISQCLLLVADAYITDVKNKSAPNAADGCGMLLDWGLGYCNVEQLEGQIWQPRA